MGSERHVTDSSDWTVLFPATAQPLPRSWTASAKSFQWAFAAGLHTDLDHEQLERLLNTNALIKKLMESYQGSGELSGWAKFVSPEMTQYFRLHRLCTKRNAKTVTIRLNHDSAEAAPRGPANHLVEIIKYTLKKLGIETELAFNLEFSHTCSTESHPLHIHGAVCIPDDRMHEVSETLGRTLAHGYRQRYKNLAAHIEKPRSAHWWAAYCIKEYGINASRLEAERKRKNRPDYVTQELAQEARAFYEGVSDWLNS